MPRSPVIGFHGCDLTVVRKVVSGRQELAPSEKEWDWLGHGLYFWEDSYRRALRWAQEAARNQQTRSKIRKPAVLGAVIDLGNCLSLTETESVDLVKDAYTYYQEACRTSGLAPARNRGPDLRARYLDCIVMETIHELGKQQSLEPFDTVRSFFIEGREVYCGAGFRELDHIQICVRSPKQVLGYFLPR